MRLYTKTDPLAVLNPAEDLEMSLAFAGGDRQADVLSLRPARFSGAGRPTGRTAPSCAILRAKHGASQISLPFAEVIFRPSGGYWADLHDLKVDPLAIDQSFLEALAPGLRSAAEGLELKGPMALDIRQMVIDRATGAILPHMLPGSRGTAPTEIEFAGPDGRPACDQRRRCPTIYWDGRITFAGASMKTGVDWEGVHGVVGLVGVVQGGSSARGSRQCRFRNAPASPSSRSRGSRHLSASIRINRIR